MEPQPRREFIKEHALDAIVVVPGVMGSVLKDEQGTIWGFENPGTYTSMWTSTWFSKRTRRDPLRALGLTPGELEALAEGTYRLETARVRPAGLIRFPAFGPVLRGFEPYTKLVNRLKDAAAHPDAVAEFAYDWRLPATFNAKVLADFLKRHLAAWRDHPEHAAARKVHPQQRDGQLIIVAHSMGGLVVQGLGGIEDGFADVRQVITLGTPFCGSVQAAVILGEGESPLPLPLPRRRLRDAARTMPGLYDLLPQNRCLLTAEDQVVRLAPSDVVNLGGDLALAQAAEHDFEARRGTALPGHRCLIGIHQPTWASLQITDGQPDPSPYAYRFDANDDLMVDEIGRPRPYLDQGDGTVWRYSAQAAEPSTPFAQQHGGLANSTELVSTIVGIVTDQGPLGLRLGAGDIGLELPDLAKAGAEFEISISGEVQPSQVTCTITNLETNALELAPQPRRSTEDALHATASLTTPGLYRVAVKADGGEPVSQILLVTPKE